ncbi:hypothetical protein TNCV_694351 [Trichonephila clavipes]|nr:hypothetical protein TNCV_694351 [Trichonephila clavipes]
MSILTLLQSVKLLMLRYIVTPPALRLDDDDIATDDIVTICLRLAVLQYDHRSNSSTFTGMESSIKVSLVAKKSNRLIMESIEMSSECATKICALMTVISIRQR